MGVAQSEIEKARRAKAPEKQEQGPSLLTDAMDTDEG